MNFVESDFRIMGVKRWKTKALESYGKGKKRHWRGGSQGQNQMDHTAQAEVTNLFSSLFHYLFVATLKFKQTEFLKCRYIY